MKKKMFFLIVLSFLAVFSVGCSDDKSDSKTSSDKDTVSDTDVIPAKTLGTVTVDLDLKDTVVRTKESVAGNFFADAVKEWADKHGYTVDFALANGGSLTCDEEKYKDCIVPAGEYTTETTASIMKWDNYIAIAEVTGTQLKEIMEHSVADLPKALGWFMNVSKGVEVTIDLKAQPEVLDKKSETEFSIKTPGQRIKSIKINGTEYDPNATYKFISNDYTIQGNDYYATLLTLSKDKKEYLDKAALGKDVWYRETIEEYIKNNTPVTPKLEGRIKFVE